jgi:hypothetical protein
MDHIARVPAGTADGRGGQFAAARRTEPQVHLAGAPDPFGKDLHAALDAVTDGPLSRAKADAAAVSRLGRLDRALAARTDGEEVRAGLWFGASTLMSGTAEVRDRYAFDRAVHHLGLVPSAGAQVRVRRALFEKRSSKQTRALWRETVEQEPDGPSRRGMLLAGLVLAGAVGRFGLDVEAGDVGV